MTSCPWCQAQCGVWTIADPIEHSTWLPLCVAAFHMTLKVPSEYHRRAWPAKQMMNRKFDERREYTTHERRVIVSTIVANDIAVSMAPRSPYVPPPLDDGAQTSWMFV